ncbi:hypothetical protein N9Y71_06755 [Luminiphilus sp.]|nr:hypothetical protein [Luminiphilus sp.]
MRKLDRFSRMAQTESVSFFCDGCDLPQLLVEKEVGRLDLFSTRSKVKKNVNERYRELTALSDIPRYGSSICFLSGTARRVLVAKYPNSAAFVAVRLRFSLDFPFLLVGLIRRLKKRAVEVLGVIKLPHDKRRMSYWLVLANNTSQVDSPIYLSISDDLGVSGLISFLNDSGVRYVVPRFFEKFPALHRESGGDVDVLVHDDDADTVRRFLRENPGRIPVDLHSVFGPAPGSGDMPYYLPKLALEMLTQTGAGPLGVKVPDKKRYFLSFLYHVLFHKGFFAGVPSQKFSEYVNQSPENDYLAFATRLATEANYDFDGTMENAESILRHEGFIPKLDTLAAISRVNSWVKKNYFENVLAEELGYSVVILKRVAADRGWVDSICEYIISRNFSIIKSELFSEKRIEELSQVLRGGNWYVPEDCQRVYFPHSAYLLRDKEFGEAYQASGGRKETRIRLLKEALRKEFDNSLHSFIHATDDTAQAFEYVEDIWGADFLDSVVDKPAMEFPTSKAKMSVKERSRLGVHVLLERMKQRILGYFE